VDALGGTPLPYGVLEARDQEQRMHTSQTDDTLPQPTHTTVIWSSSPKQICTFIPTTTTATATKILRPRLREGLNRGIRIEM